MVDKSLNETIELRTIKFSSILPLWSSAEAFRRIGEGLVANSTFVDLKFSDEEALNSAITNKILAMELYLKFIYAVDYWCTNFDKNKTKSCVCDTDDIRMLYSALLPKRQQYITSQILSDFRSTDGVEDFLSSYEQEYYRWRYSYTRKAKPHLKNKTISRILSALRKCCVHLVTEYRYIVPQSILRAINS